MKYLNVFWVVVALMAPSQLAYTEELPMQQSTETRLERGKRLLAAIDGNAGKEVIHSLSDIAPDFSNYLFEYPFGDIYARPDLDLRSREIVTIAALTAMGNAQPQLKIHIGAALNVGVKPEEIVEIMMQMSVYAGFPAALNGLKVAKEVFKERHILTAQSLPKNQQMAVERKNYSGLIQPQGPYSHAVKHNGLLFLSGLTAYASSAQYDSTAEQAEVILQQIKHIAQAEGKDLSSLIKVTIFITDIEDIEALRQVLTNHYGEYLPASSMVQIKQLFSAELKIEIEAILAVN